MKSEGGGSLSDRRNVGGQVLPRVEGVRSKPKVTEEGLGADAQFPSLHTSDLTIPPRKGCLQPARDLPPSLPQNDVRMLAINPLGYCDRLDSHS
jgi:hypothetical protein